MDILIPLGSGSKHSNIELKFCLRGIEKHCANVDSIIIVGRLPKFVKDVEYIHFNERGERNYNIYCKILEGLKHASSDEVFFMNDDHFIIEDIDITQYPFYYYKTIEYALQHRRFGDYSRVIDNTLRQLRHYNFETGFYDIHTPIRFNKLYFEGLNIFNFKQGLLIKSMYCNNWQSLSINRMEYTDCKISTSMSEAKIKQEIAGRNVFSIGENIRKEILNVLNELYPHKSRWEK